MEMRSIFMNLLLSGSLSVGLLFPHPAPSPANSGEAANNIPVAVDDSYSTSENSLLNIPTPGVLQNDISSYPDTLAASLVIGTSQGTLTLNPNGSFTYNPESNFSGTDVFTYTATDNIGTSNQARVTISVSPVNYPPSAVDDQVSTLEDTPVTIDVLVNDGDPDGNLDPTTVMIVSGATHGATSVDPLSGKVTYTPNLYFHGQDNFVYQVCDTLNACSTANVIIDVIFVNHSPVANDDQATTPEDSPIIINVTANDTDVDGNLDTSTVTIIRQVVNGSTSVNPTTGSVTYSPNLHYNGTDGFSYQVCDTAQACNTANVSITVTPVNYPPVANDDSTGTLENTPVTVDVLANDTDPDGVADLAPASVTVISPAGHGSTNVNPANGAITYTPNPNYFGTDSFSYRVYDHAGAYDEADVSIDVEEVNQPPVVNPDSATTPEDTPVLINVVANDTDPDDNLDLSTMTIVSPPTNGTASIDTPGVVLYTPNLNFNGADSFVYQICDTGKPGTTGTPPLCDSARVTITVTPVNDRPVAMADTYFMNQDTTLVVNAPGVLENDSDVDNPVITAVLEQGPARGKLKLNNDGSFTYTPEAAFAGQDTFTYHTSDGSLSSDSVAVSITVYDTQPPQIIEWLQPSIENHGIFYVTGPMVTLEVAATDNVAIDHVRFSRWDSVIKKHVDIASVQVAPYIYVLDTTTLKYGFNQVYARAYDPSGNDSGQDNFIFLYVTAYLYLPALIR